VLLPDDEISKRIQADPEDLSKSMQMESVGHAALSIKRAANQSGAKGGARPAFSQPTIHLFRDALRNLKASALTIVAESKEVEVLVLKTNILACLPETEKDKIYEDIARISDPDKPYSLSQIMRIKSENKKWEGFRERLVKDIRKS
jgi:hypothetical protein